MSFPEKLFFDSVERQNAVNKKTTLNEKSKMLPKLDRKKGGKRLLLMLMVLQNVQPVRGRGRGR